MRKTTEDDVRIGQRIKALRLSRHLSQENVGNHLGITFQQVQKYERGINRISAAYLGRIATLFGCEITEIVPRAGTVHEEQHMVFLANPLGAALVPAFNLLPQELQRIVRDMVVTLGDARGVHQ